MIRRSVPGYASVIAMTSVIAAENVQANTRVYDLGCSLGTGLMTIHDRIDTPCELIGIDNAPAMIEACNQNIAKLKAKKNISIRLECADITQADISNASLIVMHYTLQFIAPDKRLALLEKLYAGLQPGGVLIFSEKIHFEDAQTNHQMTELYYDFKKHNGYTELEISQKRQALENILISETQQTHLSRLKEAGFVKAMSWFQCLNFDSFLAYKPR